MKSDLWNWRKIQQVGKAVKDGAGFQWGENKGEVPVFTLKVKDIN